MLERRHEFYVVCNCKERVGRHKKDFGKARSGEVTVSLGGS